MHVYLIYLSYDLYGNYNIQSWKQVILYKTEKVVQ